MQVQLIRVHEDGSCARWHTKREDLNIILVIPAKTPRKRNVNVAS